MRSKWALMLALGLAACKSNEKTVEITVPSLPVYAIYNADSATKFSLTVDDDGKKLAKSYLEKAREQKEKNAVQAVYFYKRSLSLYPKYEVYLELAEVLETLGNYKELDKLYFTILDRKYENLAYTFYFRKPDFDVFMDFVVNYVRAGNIYYHDLMYRADEYGIEKQKIRQALLEEKRLPFEKDNKEFRRLEMTFVGEEEYKTYTSSPEFMEFFVQSFPVVATQWTIDQTAVSNFTYDNSLDEGEMYPEHHFGHLLLCPEKTSGSYNLNCRLLLNSPESEIALIYSIDESKPGCPKEMRIITHYIAFYDSNYTFIRCTPIAWQTPDELVTYEVKHRSWKQKTYKRVWEKPFRKDDFDNRVVATEFVKETSSYFDDFFIASQGKSLNMDHSNKMMLTE